MNLVRRRAYNGDSSHDITASGEALRDADSGGTFHGVLR